MRRRRALLLGLLAAAAVVAAGLALLGGTRVTPFAGSDVLIDTVRRGPFIRTAMAEGYLKAVRATPISVPLEAPGMQRVAWTVPDGSQLSKGDVVIRFDPTEMSRSLADGRDSRRTASLKIESARAENDTKRESLLSEARLARGELEQAERFARADEEIFSRQEIIDSEIDQELARERARSAGRRSDLVDREGRARIDLLRIEREKAQLQVSIAERGLAALEVRSPHDGLLVLERNWRGEATRPGDQVWPGQKLAEIPDPTSMEARVYVVEPDAGGLEAGCRATLVVEAHPERSFPARVDRVDALAKTRFWNVPVQYFEATLAPEETDPEIMKPGQRVRAEIVLESIDDALTVPRQAVFDRDGSSIVYRRAGGELEPVEVTVGAHSLSHVIIEAGLEEGDRVALSDPNRSGENDRAAAGRNGGSRSPGVAP